MNKLFFKTLGIIASIVLLISCSKDDSDSESEPNNPINGKSTAIFNSSISYNSMTDIEGNVYKTITIGTQTWMAENLRTTKYNDGTKIPNVIDYNEWDNLTSGAYCNYDNKINSTTIGTYGRLYNWYTVNTGKLSPTGWRIPNNSDWQTLINYLGGVEVAGEKLKEIGETHWTVGDGVTNSSGFTALPGGVRYSQEYYGINDEGFWWSATEDYLSGLAYYQNLFSWTGEVRKHYGAKQYGFSVRCVQ